MSCVGTCSLCASLTQQVSYATSTVCHHCFAEAGEPTALQQQRSRALQLCSQLQRAALLAQQQGNANSGTDDSLSGSMQLPRGSSGRSSSSSGFSTARTVLALLDSNRDLLDAMPKVGWQILGVGGVFVVSALPHMQQAFRQQAPERVTVFSLHAACARPTAHVVLLGSSYWPVMAGRSYNATDRPCADGSWE